MQPLSQKNCLDKLELLDQGGFDAQALKNMK